MSDQVYFYPHPYLRDRQLDTIRRWPARAVLNPDLAAQRTGAQVSAGQALGRGVARSFRSLLPLPNIKRRPDGVPRDATVYVWGGLIATGPFITDLDNPYSLVGYNLRAMPLLAPLLRAILLSERCRGIRCMSEACRGTLAAVLGPEVAAKAEVHYPRIDRQVDAVTPADIHTPARFVFIGTQFDIKGGPALLRAFARVAEAAPGTRLDVVTHLPPEHAALADIPGLVVHPATFSRQETWQRFLRQADVLVHPTYVDSFGMVALEALAHGLALVATDVYALGEMVETGRNGALIRPAVSIWDGVRPAPLYHALHRAREEVAKVDTTVFEQDLAAAMIGLATDPDRLLAARRASLELFGERFAG